MTDKIGPDGLTDEERGVRARLSSDFLEWWTSNYATKVLDTLAAERLAHAQTQAEQDKLRARLESVLSLVGENGCDCECDHGYDDHVVGCDGGDACVRCLACRVESAARALLGEVKP